MYVYYEPAGALAVLVGMSLINTLIENVVFSSLAGKGLKLSPTIMFLSLLYWGYVLGVSGALVAIPLTIVVKIMLVSFKETKWIARFVGLLGD